jgi:hypothetical protein
MERTGNRRLLVTVLSVGRHVRKERKQLCLYWAVPFEPASK